MSDLKQILNTSIRFNEENAITGGLIFNLIDFVQVLEDDEADICSVTQRITHDARHKDVIAAEAQPVTERLFGA